MMTGFREYKEIPVGEVDAADETFLISYPRSSAGLRRSVGHIGLLNPLLLRRHEGDMLQVITGFRRLSACLEGGVKEVPALLYPEGLGRLTAFGLAIHDNLNRGYNLIEKGNILHKLVNLFHAPLEEVVGGYMPLLGIEPGRSLLGDYLSLQGLTEGMRGYVYQTEMPLSCAARIATYSGREQDALLEFLGPLRPGFNKLREMLVNGEETAARQGMDMADILAREELKAVNQSHAARPRKLEMARAALRRIRFPTVSATEAMVEESLKLLGLPRDVALHLPPYLEGDSIRAELKFKSAEELRRLAEKLIEVSKRDEFGKICGLL